MGRAFSLCTTTTRTGYQKHIQKYAEPVQAAANIRVGAEGADGVDLSNKVIAVTGANSGLGKMVATYAAAKGAKLFMLCRSMDRATKAREEIVEQTGNESVEIIQVDVAELASVRQAVKDLQSKTDRLDALVCNAGGLFNERKVSSEGNEITFASHLLGGSYLLPSLLMNQLKASGDQARVIFVTSGGMYNFKMPKWDVLTSTKEGMKFDGVSAYAYAKRGQVLLAERWTQEYPEITVVSAHPGWTDTPGVDEAFGDQKKYLEPMRTPWHGAEGMAWLLGTDRKNLEGGALYLDRLPQRKHLAGPFFTEGRATKNTPEEVDELMENLKKAAGL